MKELKTIIAELKEALKVAAEYQGKDVQLNKPTKGDRKKYKVYVKDPKTDNVKKVEFGDPNLEIKRDDPERRKNFRSRHKCDSDPKAKDKTTPKYWSCRFWEGGKTVTELLNKKSFLAELEALERKLAGYTFESEHRCIVCGDPTIHTEEDAFGDDVPVCNDRDCLKKFDEDPYTVRPIP